MGIEKRVKFEMCFRSGDPGFSELFHRKELGPVPRTRSQLCSDPKPQNNVRDMLIHCGVGNKQKPTTKNSNLNHTSTL